LNINDVVNGFELLGFGLFGLGFFYFYFSSGCVVVKSMIL